ncbi:DUF5681 domain-containing protein [Nitratireductor sp. GCM10026969]|uniref:DUF5681 domain-containing protein n=1 Tax=Nitratireductor sp. GCM10026969 TaxID=3252645 RepID=UPI003610A77B
MSDYKVGRGRPPRESQFKPGQSGNPGGRPKKNGTVDVLSTLEEPVRVVQNGRECVMSPKEATMRTMVAKAVKKGDLNTIIYLIEQFEKYGLLAQPKASSVLRLPNSMPWRMALEVASRFGAPLWTKSQILDVRKHYLASHTEEERLLDEALEYLDL